MAQDDAKSSFTPPSITETDLLNFYSAHFSEASTCYFSTQFISPADRGNKYEAEEDDDDLGYYPDGVKRTLTDQQIAMFRHSEVQRLLRERRCAEEVEPSTCGNKDLNLAYSPSNNEAKDENSTPAMGKEPFDQAVPQTVETDERADAVVGGKKKRRQQQRKGGLKQQPKPDLRKRTWDKVDRGLEGLDYGDDCIAMGPVAKQRKQISYDDM